MNNRNMSNKTLWITVIVVLAILIIAGVIYEKNKNSAMNNGTNNQAYVSPTPSDTVTPTPTASETPTPTAMRKTAPTPTQEYLNALKIYQAKGAIVQFVSCHGNPQSLVLKKNALFMLDNRDEASHTISANNQTFKLAAYGYVIATAKNSGNYNTVCDAKTAAGVITVEK